jgi:hypothetical protein
VDAVSGFLGARGDDLVFVHRRRQGGTLWCARSPLQAGDEILVTNLGCRGVTPAASAAAPKASIRVQGASIAPDDDELVEAEQVQGSTACSPCASGVAAIVDLPSLSDLAQSL